MATIRGYMAASLDGYIADASGNYDFLTPYDSVEYGFAGFMAEIGTCVFGRTTYDQSMATPGAAWPFAGKRNIVVTGTPLTGAGAANDAEVWQRGVGPDLVTHLRELDDGDVWIVGGAKLQGALLDLDAVDRLQITLTPDLLGDGIPLFPKSPRSRRLELADVTRFDRGLVMLDYRLR